MVEILTMIITIAFNWSKYQSLDLVRIKRVYENFHMQEIEKTKATQSAESNTGGNRRNERISSLLLDGIGCGVAPERATKDSIFARKEKYNNNTKN